MSVRKRYSSRLSTNKENILEKTAPSQTCQQKLHTMSEITTQIMYSTKQQVIGWLTDATLVERVNKVKTKHHIPAKKDHLKLNASKIILECRKRLNNPEMDFKSGVQLLKREAEYLQQQRNENANSMQRFPRKQEIIQKIEREKQEETMTAPYRILNNFCSRERYSAIVTNRKKIKGLNKSGPYKIADFYSTYSKNLSKCSGTDSKEIFKRPFSSTFCKSDRYKTDRFDLTGGRYQMSKNKNLSSVFKRCRMNRRNRSARFSVVESHFKGEEFRECIKGSKIPPYEPSLSIIDLDKTTEL